jgi:hypothetical protein
MADKKYEEISDNIEEKVSQFVDTFSEKELEHALGSLNAPSDIRQLLIDKIAERFVIKERKRLEPGSLILTDDLDKLLVVALSSARIKKAAAEKILACKDGSNQRHLSNLLRFGLSTDIDPEIARAVDKITDDWLFAGTDIRERSSKVGK